MNISAYIMSCPDREEMREQTLLNLTATDWHEEPGWRLTIRRANAARNAKR